MVQLKGMARRALSCVLCLVLLGLCTGCAGLTDRFRPDLNLSDGMRIFINEEGEGGGDPSVQPGETANVAASVWSGGSPNNKGFQYKNPNRDVDTSNFAETPGDMIECTDYGKYLREQVYEELLKAISGVPKEKRDQLYIRVGHTGYDYDNGKMHKVSGWSGTESGRTVTTDKMVGGGTLITLATDWVGDLSINSEHRESQISYAQSSIRNYMTEEDMGKDWYALAGSKLPNIYYKMFGREGANFKTLQEYYDAIATSPYKNIPNYNLYYYTGVNTTNKMTFNKISGNTTDRYVEGIPIETVDKLFGTYNQYLTREREAKSSTITDTSSILRYDLDGYSKTVIFIGTTTGTDLKELVGDLTYSKLTKLASEAYKNTDVSAIKGIKKTIYDDMGMPIDTVDYSNFTVIPAGSKGVD